MKKIIVTLIFACALLFAFNASAETAKYNGYIVKLKPTVGLMSDDFHSDGIMKVDRLEDIPKYISESDIEYIEPNYYLELYGTSTGAYYDDALYDMQYNMEMINAPYVWKTGCLGQEIKIAVIDSGVNAVSDLKKNLLPGYSFVDEDTTDVSDVSNHGTPVSGLIAAEANNNRLIAGLANCAKIVPLKCIKYVSGKGYQAEIIDVANAIRKAVDDFDCDVINMSLGTSTNSETMRAAVNYALSKNVIVVAACGNETDSTVNYPASYDGVISVGSVNSSKIWQSNRNEFVDIGAPGHGVISLSKNENKRCTCEGSSFAAPLVSALAAMCMNFNPDITYEEFDALLKETSDKFTDNGFSYGIVNAKKMVEKLLEGKKCFVAPLNGNNATVYNNCENDFEAYAVLKGENKLELKSISVPAHNGVEVKCVDDSLSGENFKFYVWNKSNFSPLFVK